MGFHKEWGSLTWCSRRFLASLHLRKYALAKHYLPVPGVVTDCHYDCFLVDRFLWQDLSVRRNRTTKLQVCPRFLVRAHGQIN